jgi:hypothetical protein
VTAVFDFGSEPFVLLRAQIWLSIFREAAQRNVSLIFTFAPERTVRASFRLERWSTQRCLTRDSRLIRARRVLGKRQFESANSSRWRRRRCKRARAATSC